MISRLLRLGRLGAVAGLLLGTFAASGASAATSVAARASIWSVVPTVSPQSGQLDNSFLQGVSMASATEGWAVGEFMDPTSVISPLVEHWNGTRWLRVTAPAISGS